MMEKTNFKEEFMVILGHDLNLTQKVAISNDHYLHRDMILAAESTSVRTHSARMGLVDRRMLTRHQECMELARR